MDVTTSYWRQFAAYVRAQRTRSQRRSVKPRARALTPINPTRKLGLSNPLAAHTVRREARFTIH
jgi:hypothetical protein